MLALKALRANGEVEKITLEVEAVSNTAALIKVLQHAWMLGNPRVISIRVVLKRGARAH